MGWAALVTQCISMLRYVAIELYNNLSKTFGKTYTLGSYSIYEPPDLLLQQYSNRRTVKAQSRSRELTFHNEVIEW